MTMSRNENNQNKPGTKATIVIKHCVTQQDSISRILCVTICNTLINFQASSVWRTSLSGLFSDNDGLSVTMTMSGVFVLKLDKASQKTDVNESLATTQNKKHV